MWKSIAFFAVIATALTLYPAIAAGNPDVQGNAVGIDLGTTYSCVGVFKNGRVEIITNDQGNRITPSYVGWDASGERLIGDAAKNQASINPEQTVFDVKRLIGRKYTDKTVQSDKKLVPFDVVDSEGKPYIQINLKGEQRKFAPEEISAMVLGKMRSTAEAFLGEEVENAVVDGACLLQVSNIFTLYTRW